ncbi:MAG: hypothetical protein P4L79_03310 [Legionella sp.]|uniref:hypothetical protein n=1 Tax=Legionella sp. TaxID=459 RepID=UPI0028468D24|nr:hypothetical protein [Legionella sp.]
MHYQRQHKTFGAKFSLGRYQRINLCVQPHSVLRKHINILKRKMTVHYLFFFIFLGFSGVALAHASLLPELMIQLDQPGAKTMIPCNKRLGSCSVTVAQKLSCLAQPGSITITNTSKIAAQNIRAFSADSNFLAYVVQNNKCPARLLPGASCSISFYTNMGLMFLVANVAVKGSNTAAVFFDMQAINCNPSVALISASPLSLNMTTTSPGNVQTISVVNSASSSIDAEAITVDLSGTGGAISANYTNCNSVAPGGTCTITLTANSVFPATTISIKGQNTNLVSVGVSVVSQSLSVPSTAIVPVNDSVGVDIPVTNLTANTLTNVGIDLSSTGWTGVTSTTCPVLSGFGTCTVTITSNTATPYLAQGGIIFTADNLNVSTPIALAFSMYGYLVFSIPDSSTAYVVDTNDAAGSPVIWSSTGISGDTDYTSLWGIGETSTSSIPIPNATEPSGQTATQYSGQQNCNGGSDGACNSENIFIYYNSIISGAPVSTDYYAEGLCYRITTDNSGGVSAGTWFLPAICQLGVYGGGVDAGCGSSTENITTNLFLLGFVGDLQTNQFYWSSTESSSTPLGSAWYQEFRPGPVYEQFPNVKFGQFSVRCIRAVSY